MVEGLALPNNLGIKFQELIHNLPCLAKEFGLYNKEKKFRMLLGGSIEDDLRWVKKNTSYQSSQERPHG